MNFAGFQKIIASTAAHIDRAVADKVSEVTGPKALSEYDIGDQVGSGGPGLLWKLYKAKPKSKAQQELSAEVCVWFLDKKALSEERSKRGTSKSAEDALLDVFRADAKLLQKLRHPGIVRVVDALEETKNAMAMVTEPLFSSVANALGNLGNIAKVPEELHDMDLGQLETKHGVLQITETLSFLHTQAKLVHRSISPETVFLTTTGGWKFGGFGFAALVDQVAAEEVSSFHYPEYDVDTPALPLQPLLDYSAPEMVKKPLKSMAQVAISPSAMDIFSLGALIFHLVAKKPLFNSHNNQNTYLNKIQGIQRETFHGIPLELDNELRKMLNIEPSSRPTALEFSASPWFKEDIRVRALRFLDHMLERDNLQKSEFFKSLNGLWSGFDPRVLRYKVLPPLLAELKNEALLQFTLPLILHIAENQSSTDYELYTQPSLIPIFQTAVGETLLILIKSQPMLVSKSSPTVVGTQLLPLLVRGFEEGDPRVQEESLRQSKQLALTLDFDLVRAAILPRVHALALKTSVAAVRVQALLCLAELAQRLDRSAVMDVLQTCARCASVDHSPPTLMCVLAVADTIYKQHGLEFAAENLLPLLTPLLVTQQLSPPQFAKYMQLVYDILHKIEEKRGVNLKEADSVSLDFAGLSLSSNSTPEPFPVPSKPIQTSKPTKSWDATDDWGPMSDLNNNSLPGVKSPDPLDFISSTSAVSPPLPQSPASISLGNDFLSSESSKIASQSAPQDPFDVPLKPTSLPVIGQSSPSSSFLNPPKTQGISTLGSSSFMIGNSMSSPQNKGVTSQPLATSGLMPQTFSEEEDPFADWPPRLSANSMLAPPSSTGGLGGFTQPGTTTWSTNPSLSQSQPNPNTQYQAVNLDDFFPTTQPQKAPTFGTPLNNHPPVAASGIGGFSFAPPPPAGSSVAISTGLGRGRGRGNVQSQQNLSNQGSLLDLL